MTLKVTNFYQALSCKFIMLISEWGDKEYCNSMEHHHQRNFAHIVMMLVLRSWLQTLHVDFIHIHLAAVHQQHYYDNKFYNLATKHRVWHWTNNTTVDDYLGYEVTNLCNSTDIHTLLNVCYSIHFKLLNMLQLLLLGHI